MSRPQIRLLLASSAVSLALGACAACVLWPRPVPVAPEASAHHQDRLARHDPELGWANRPGRYLLAGAPVTILEDGTRAPRGDPRVLVLGDSFAFGWGVAGGEAWPARLGATNAAVLGYGLDQIVMQAERLPRPEQLVVGLIPDDVVRCGLAAFQRRKPWFTARGGRLALHGLPVPETRLAHGRRVLAPGGDAERVAGLLVDRLAALRVPVLLVLAGLPTDDPGPLRRVGARAERRGLQVLDLLDLLRDRELLLPRSVDPSGHPSPAGHEAIAAAVAERVGR